MIELINIEQSKKWNSIVKGFSDWDIYYTNEYARSLQLHGDGEPELLYWKGNDQELCYVIMIEDISAFDKFHGILEANKYFDAITPYGYGGPLYKGDFTDKDRELFMKDMMQILQERTVISQFFRFHPLLDNHQIFSQEFAVKTLKSTIVIDTSNEQVIWENMDSSNRNMVRKAIKSGVTIKFDHGERVNDFIAVYNATMDSHEADKYYYFAQEYYDYLINEMQENVIFAYSLLDGEVIGASIFFYNDRFMHYHLSGTYAEYRKLASTNLLLFEASKWANRNGIEKLHLGGGMDSEDSLYKFKKKFNKKGECPFYIGRLVVDEERYDFLLKLRKQYDESFDMNNRFMIQYRK